MIAKKLIQNVNAKDLNASLLNINQKMENLNIEYNYTELVATITQFEYYYNLLAKSLGAEYSIKVETKLEHNGKIRIDLVKAGKPLTLENVNTTFHLATDMLIEFNTSIRSMYQDYYNNFIDTNSEISNGIDVESSETITELANETIDLQNSAVDKGATAQEISEAYQSATEATNEKAEEAEQEANDLWDTVWSTNTNSTSEEQDKAMAAAEAFARDNANINELNTEAANARADADQAAAAWNTAAAEAAQAQQDYDNAIAARDSAEQAYTEASLGYGGALDVQSLERDGELPQAGETKGYTGVADPNTFVEVTNNGDGTYTYTVTDANGNSDTRTSTLSDIVSGADQTNAHERVDDTHNEYAAAAQAAAEAQQNKNDADDKAAEAAKAAAEADNKADSAAQAASDASIPVASGSDLDNGWYNDSGSEGIAETDESIVNDFDFGD